tara:strand:+ start:7172 stop:9454 length:2283 start_codon:yes stop_codon:yes gene_type:complete
MTNLKTWQNLVNRLWSKIKRILAPFVLKKTSLKPELNKESYKIATPEDNIRLSVTGLLRPCLYFVRIVQESDDSLMGAHLTTVTRNQHESDQAIHLFVTKDHSEFYGTVKITEDIEALIFYPSRLPVNIKIQDCYLRAINTFGRDYIYGQTYVRLRSFGLSWTINRVREETEARIQRLIKGRTDDSYATWWELYGKPSQAVLSEQRESNKCIDTASPDISIIMPVYETRLMLLKKAVDSVLNQSFSNWELCIADDASSSSAIRSYLNKLDSSDERIRIVFRKENGHISAASNSALDLARGTFVGFLDHDDELSPNALHEVMQVIRRNFSTELVYSDEDVISEKGKPLYPQFKPDWNLDFARSINYICHFMVIRRERVEHLGGFREGGYEGAQDFDLMLRATERLTPDQIQHIPHILYHWRASSNSTVLDHSNKSYSTEAGIKALQDHIERLELDAEVEPSEIPTAYRIRYRVPQPQPSVTLIIPTYNNLRVLRNCVDSVLEKTEYKNYEVLIIDNGTDEKATLDYLRTLQKPQVRVLEYLEKFNFSAINNFAVSNTHSEVLVLLNNDTEVCNSDWLMELVGHAVRPEVGAVGAKLFYAQNLIQHAGVLLGMGPDRVAGHAFKGEHKHVTGPMARTRLTQAYSAVTGACMAVTRKKYLEVGGLDENNLAIAFNDVDFCLKLQEKGYTNVWTPYAQLYHYESYSRGHDHGDSVKHERFLQEKDYMINRWGDRLTTDPYYNPNLTRDFSNFSLAWPPFHEGVI